MLSDELLEVTALKREMRQKFEKQFPDLIDNHVAWMCWREGWQRGAEDAYTEAYNLGDWKWE